MELVRYTGFGEWSALYVDGKLDCVGDHYIIDDRISELAGVKEIQSTDFMRGGDGRSDVAQTLTDATAYGLTREAAFNSAKDLRATALKLIRDAEELERIK